MKFMLPVGGIVDHRFGILTSPGHKGIPIGIVEGMQWAADNQAFTQGFNPDVFFTWLETMLPYRETCLFVAVPDVVGDCLATLENFRKWRSYFDGWRVAFVAQDGQEDLELPTSQDFTDWIYDNCEDENYDYKQMELEWLLECADFDVIFVGGSTDWKLSQGAIDVIRLAQRINKHIHIGRVNNWKRYIHFAKLQKDKEFTCDGTKTRFDGVEKTIKLWSGYMERYERQIHLPLFDSHNLG